MDGRTDGRTDQCLLIDVGVTNNGWMDGQTNWWMDRLMDLFIVLKAGWGQLPVMHQICECIRFLLAMDYN